MKAQRESKVQRREARDSDKNNNNEIAKIKEKSPYAVELFSRERGDDCDQQLWCVIKCASVVKSSTLCSYYSPRVVWSPLCSYLHCC